MPSHCDVVADQRNCVVPVQFAGRFSASVKQKSLAIIILVEYFDKRRNEIQFLHPLDLLSLLLSLLQGLVL